jgi:hypothetical protein
MALGARARYSWQHGRQRRMPDARERPRREAAHAVEGPQGSERRRLQGRHAVRRDRSRILRFDGIEERLDNPPAE